MVSLADLDLITDCGQGLNLEEQCGLQAAITKCEQSEMISGLQFWGRINGTTRDYLICCAVDPVTDFPAKQFFYCTTGSFELKRLTSKLLSASQAELAQKLHATYTFTGDATAPIGEVKEEEVKEGEEGITPGDATYREVHHLAYVVWAVDTNTSVVPKGAISVDESGRAVRNSTFPGLSASEAKVISSFYHFRDPQARAVQWKNKTGAVKSEDVLDQVAGPRPIEQGASPVGAWALALNADATRVNIRSLEYPGYFFCHQLNSSRFGGVYIGDGRFNIDLGFMV